MNPEKALITSCYGCRGTPSEITNTFDDLRALSQSGGNVLSYHIIQSFKPGEATPEQVHLAGKMLCDKLLNENYKYVLCTHTDKEHLHNHIIFCKTNMENLKSFGTLMDTKKFPAWKRIRQLNDEVCKEMNLSTVKFVKVGKGISHYEWEQKKHGTSWKEKLKYELDCIICRSVCFDDFLEKCRLNNIEVVCQPDKRISLKFHMGGQERFIRARTLGIHYLPESIMKQITQYYRHRKYVIEPSKSDALYLQRWADIQNMKNVANMINLLESYNVHGTSEVRPGALSALAESGMMVDALEQLDKKINQLSEEIELLRVYRKNKSTQDEYKSLPERKRKKFAEKNASALQSYHNAGAHLKSLFPDGKFPSVMSVNQQRQQLVEERKNLSDEYHSIRKKYSDLSKAQNTIEDYLENLRDK